MDGIGSSSLVILSVACKGSGNLSVTDFVHEDNLTSLVVNHGNILVVAAVGDGRQFVGVNERGSGEVVTSINGKFSLFVLQTSVLLGHGEGVTSRTLVEFLVASECGGDGSFTSITDD